MADPNEDGSPLEIKVQLLTPNAIMPTKAYPADLGFDFYAVEDFNLAPGQTRTISTDVAIELPIGWGALALGRSSWAKQGVDIFGGVFDNGYRGPIHLIIFNSRSIGYLNFKRGDKLMQLVPIPSPIFVVREVTQLSPSDRGNKGFGSSGR